MPIHPFQTHQPQLGQNVYLAPGSQLIGDVVLGDQASVWFNSVLRGDTDEIRIGRETNIQDLSVGHADPGFPLIVGERVTVGHKCIIHGCTIEDDCLIGMGSTIMNGVVIGRGSIVGAGSVVLENTKVPPFSLVVGSPAKVRKTYPEEVIETIRRSSKVYCDRAAQYRETTNTGRSES